MSDKSATFAIGCWFIWAALVIGLIAAAVIVAIHFLSKVW